MTKSLTQTQAAERLRISTSWLRTLTTRGILNRNSDGSYGWPDVAEEFDEYRASLEAKEEDGTPADYERARARKEAARARLAELEVLEREGELIPRAVVERVYGRMLDVLRSAILNIPGRWGAQIVGLDTPREGQAALTKITTEILEDLSGSAADKLAAEFDA